MWKVRHTRTFYKELSVLPTEVRERIEKIAFGEEIKQDHLLNGKVQKLEGYKQYYKIRIGHYRIGLWVDSDENIIEFRRVLHRKEIYRRFP